MRRLKSIKTLTTASYTGVNGTISLNTFLGADGSPSDRLIINGGTASGDTLLRTSPMLEGLGQGPPATESRW
ncbi:autotransporter outer membrane beta-barrel domain-containing protein [Paraburkholderia sp. MM5384-R2]|uniref:autotransporter outer membrane beta-barrel domain-containing protein n=1 Tax=Paraburkholderia sp. MM5384-R2 TaxID=2723097 RepID=UPI0017F19611|nr:autotransporter outer membrane beta-barrel domain-containing protein [Paraburkholderia sp. MM5384-R2]MBB5501525.1 outer membrane autotransporter protein [Paraburkholderia sp. MM5384-R2]